MVRHINYMAKKSNCRYCGNELRIVIDLGDLYPSAYINKGEEIFYDKEPLTYDKEPLAMAVCPNCNLVQLSHNFNLDDLYKEYYYKSNANSDMIKSLQDIVSEIEQRIKLKNNDAVLDIGANDGTLLSLYNNKNLLKIGIDPCITFHQELMQKADITISDYFDRFKYPIKQKPQVITFIACFYDLPNPKQVAEELKNILADDGLLVIQFTDLFNTWMLNEFSNICQEHIEYYSINWLYKFFNEIGLQVFDISQNNTNGGSTRFYISHPNAFKIEDSVERYLKLEKDYINSFDDVFESFKSRIYFNKDILCNFLKQQADNNKVVMGLGSSTKFNTTAQFYNLNSNLIKCIGEISEAKIGKFTLGTSIPIVHEKQVFDSNPDFIMVNIWQFRPFFEKLLKGYVDRGGQVIFPLPEPEIWNKDGVFKI